MSKCKNINIRWLRNLKLFFGNYYYFFSYIRVGFGMGFLRDPKSRVKNSENSKISGIGIGIWKSRKNPEWKIPKILKSPGSGFIFFVISPESSFEIDSGFSKNPRDFVEIPGIRYSRFLSPGFGLFLVLGF